MVLLGVTITTALFYLSFFLDCFLDLHRLAGKMGMRVMNEGRKMP